MKIAIDVSPLESGHKVRGVGFYLKHLKDALTTYFPGNSYQFFTSANEIISPDVVHYPYFEPFILHKILNNFPTIVTIHDLTPLKFPKHFPVGIRGSVIWRVNKQLVKKNAAIITDSESSKNDIHTFLHIPKDKIHVVYLAAGEEFGKAKVASNQAQIIKEKYNLPERFALYVGDVTWNKNLPRTIRASLLAQVPLVLVGKAISETEFDHSHPWNSDRVEVQKLITDNPSIHALGFVSTDDLVTLYTMATLAVFPSLYEGFGLPVVEAMQSGCPVVTSKEGSLPEVGGDSVYYVDAKKDESIAEGIKKVFSDPHLQKSLQEKELAQVKKFSWKKTAERTLSVYEEVHKRI